MKIRVFLYWFTATALIASDAQAYIDPGVTYAMIQGLFAVAFGAAVGWVLRPWRYIKGLFSRGVKQDDQKRDQDTDATPNGG